jgi:ribosomal-protein-alanine acetyltransferase
MKPIQIQPLKLKHLEVIQEISQTCFSSPKEYLTLSFLMPLWVSSRRLWGSVAVIDHKIVGYILFDINHKAQQADVLSTAVLPEFQRQGISKKLLIHSLDAAKDFIEDCYLEVRSSNQTAQHIYISQGFKKINAMQNYYGPGEDALVFKRTV